MFQGQKRQGLKGSVIPDASENGKCLSRDEILAKARDEQLKAISLRNRAKDKDSTTSLSDLSLARKPRKPHRKQRVEDTVWENDLGVGLSDTYPPPSKPDQAQMAARGLNIYSDQESGSFTSLRTAANVQGGAIVRTENDGTHYEKHPPQTSQVLQSGTMHSTHSGQGHNQVHHQEELRTHGNDRWASKVDLQPIKADVDRDSNAWGSSIPSDASQNSNDSVQPLHFGKLFRNRDLDPVAQPLLGWDGKMQPPPPDWNDRPRFNNNNPASIDGFSRWITDVMKMTCHKGESIEGAIEFKTLPNEAVKDLRYHPDGLSLVPRVFTIDEHNASHYGYTDPAEATKYCQHMAESDFEDWGKLDLRRHENSAFKDETTDDLVNNWIANTQRHRNLIQPQHDPQQKTRQTTNEYRAESKLNPNSPILNVYLRPALRGDMEQTLDIYNWYIENSPRPAEMFQLTESDMRDRLSNCKSNKLPFLVAVTKHNSKSTLCNTTTDLDEFENNPYSTQGTDPNSMIIRGTERVVGWAAATDFTACDFVERIAVELEVYVHPEHRQRGIGRCLLDKLLEAVDRGYIKRGGYRFHCAQELRHLYSPGGGRDLHKLMIILRKWKHPKALHSSMARSDGRFSTSRRKLDDLEDDYDQWLKKWLETWNFQVEGTLSGIGAKNGRYIDAVYLGRETMWQPAEGYIPDPLPGTY